MGWSDARANEGARTESVFIAQGSFCFPVPGKGGHGHTTGVLVSYGDEWKTDGGFLVNHAPFFLGERS
jgi:hypothetical protein